MKTIKPWGYEILHEKNDKYVVKELFMKSGHSCSLQYHKHKHETVIVVKGKLLFYYHVDGVLFSKKLVAGNVEVISPNSVHRMEALVDSLYYEASTPELDDVIRLEDSYGRI